MSRMSRSATPPYIELGPDAARSADAPLVFVRLRSETFVNAPTNLPHRHGFHEIFLIEAGRLRHTVDGESRDIGPHSLSLISRGQVHLLDRIVGAVGWMLRVAEELLPAGADAPFSVPPSGYPALALSPVDLESLAAFPDLIEEESARPAGPERDAALRAVLTLLLLRIERIARTAGADHAAREEQRIYRDFINLLEQDYVAQHGVAHYAQLLGLDADRLSTVLNHVLGLSTKRVIDDRLMLEAKRLLRHSGLSLKEIAVELGYADQFHLSKVFKRIVGLSPQEYRRVGKST
ncbi:MAG TPA: AraC family transcriptional regulator [Thermomicrobiales bacterium]|nr:AraC family transcriptional regulator [Thermomicrobiales bacterium]